MADIWYRGVMHRTVCPGTTRLLLQLKERDNRMQDARIFGCLISGFCFALAVFLLFLIW